MRLLVISHNVFSETDNTGKTLSGLFRGWNKEDVAQFYIHDDQPTSPICDNYFRITDKEALKSIVTRKCGRVLKCEHNVGQVHKRGNPIGRSMSSAFVYWLRNLIWRLSAWRSKELLSWVDSFDPEAIYFVSGDYAFIYRVALDLAKYKSIPLFLYCGDDYYFYPGVMGKIGHRSFMRQVKKLIDYSAAIFTICDKMATDYEQLFKKKCYTLYTSASFSEPLQGQKNNKISYIGNLGYGRNAMLVNIGRALLSLNVEGKPEYIDVYSAETDSTVLRDLTHENGINFCGRISAEQVKQVMAQNLAVIHTESFEEAYRNRVRYSVSTKIADSLMSGTCLVAYGPDDVASMEYLIRNDAAITITATEELPQKLNALFTEHRTEIIDHARILAVKNHNEVKNMKMIAEVMENYIKKP